MTKINEFQDIFSWQKGRELVVNIYRAFSNSKDFGFRDQIQRASVSVITNIAEGFERRTNADFKHFLYMAKASNAEVRSLLIIARDLNYIPNETYEKNYGLSITIGKLISALIKTL